jgi:hypothetical protein
MSRHVIPRAVTTAFYIIVVVVVTVVDKDCLLASSPRSSPSAMTQNVVKVGHVHHLPEVQISAAAALAPPNVVHLPSPVVDTNAVGTPFPAKAFATIGAPLPVESLATPPLPSRPSPDNNGFLPMGGFMTEEERLALLLPL